jgi:hypothetical protein
MIAFSAIGGILLLVGSIWILVAAFKESVLWGVISLCVPFGALVFAIQRFAELKTPIILYIVGFVLSLIGNVGAMK